MLSWATEGPSLMKETEGAGADFGFAADALEAAGAEGAAASLWKTCRARVGAAGDRAEARQTAAPTMKAWRGAGGHHARGRAGAARRW